MRCFAILAIALAFLTHCLAQNAVVAKTPRKSDVSQTKLCELVLQKLELSQRREDKKTVIPIDNIISLLEIIKKSTSKESGQAVENSTVNRDLGKSSESGTNGTRRFRGRYHWRPQHSHRTTHQVLETIPEVIRVIKEQPEYNDPPDEERAYLEGSYYYPSERRSIGDPPPYHGSVTRSNIQLNDPQVDEEPERVGSEAQGTSMGPSVRTRSRLNDASENEKVTRSPKQGSNDTLDALKHLMGNNENAKIKALLKTMIASQKAGSAGEKKERTKPEVVKTIKTKSEPAQQAAPKDKKSPSRRNKPSTKGKDIPDAASNRLATEDDWEWNAESLMYRDPRILRSKLHRDDENVNQNVNVNTNTDRDTLRYPRVSSSRRAYGTRVLRYQDRHNFDKNTNVNSNTNTANDDAPPSVPAIDRLVSMRRSLDDPLDDDFDNNVNTNVNTNSNLNRHVLPRNKRRGREQWRLV